MMILSIRSKKLIYVNDGRVMHNLQEVARLKQLGWKVETQLSCHQLKACYQISRPIQDVGEVGMYWETQILNAQPARIAVQFRSVSEFQPPGLSKKHKTLHRNELPVEPRTRYQWHLLRQLNRQRITVSISSGWQLGAENLNNFVQVLAWINFHLEEKSAHAA